MKEEGEGRRTGFRTPPSDRTRVVKVAKPHALEHMLRLSRHLIRPEHLAKQVDPRRLLPRLTRAAPVDELVPRWDVAL